MQSKCDIQTDLARQKRFVKLLQTALEVSNITTQAGEDDYILIANTAKFVASQYKAIVIVRQDIDLLVLQQELLLQRAKPGRGYLPEVFYSPTSLKVATTSNMFVLKKEVLQPFSFKPTAEGCTNIL